MWRNFLRSPSVEICAGGWTSRNILRRGSQPGEEGEGGGQESTEKEHDPSGRYSG